MSFSLKTLGPHEIPWVQEYWTLCMSLCYHWPWENVFPKHRSCQGIHYFENATFSLGEKTKQLSDFWTTRFPNTRIVLCSLLQEYPNFSDGSEPSPFTAGDLLWTQAAPTQLPWCWDTTGALRKCHTHRPVRQMCLGAGGSKAQHHSAKTWIWLHDCEVGTNRMDFILKFGRSALFEMYIWKKGWSR